jgi:hypothetical protein
MADDCDPEPLLSQDVCRAFAGNADQVGHKVRCRSLAPADKQRHPCAGGVGCRYLRDYRVRRVLARTDFGDGTQLEAVLLQAQFGAPDGFANEFRHLCGGASRTHPHLHAAAAPDVFANNLETVRRLTPVVRDARAGYDQTLGVLARMRAEFPGVVTKSSIMVGLGETEAEVVEAMRDLRAHHVDILTLGQYLRPSAWHLPVQEWVSPERFDGYREQGLALGFRYVAAGPLVRSSYHAEKQAVRPRAELIPLEQVERG